MFTGMSIVGPRCFPLTNGDHLQVTVLQVALQLSFLLLIVAFNILGEAIAPALAQAGGGEGAIGRGLGAILLGDGTVDGQLPLGSGLVVLHNRQVFR